MGKPVFKLKIKQTSKAKEEVRIDIAKKREEQLNQAVAWCIANGKRGWAACNSWLFPLIRDRQTIKKTWFDGNVKTGEEKEYCSVLTVDEEEMIIHHVKNKNR